MKKFIDHTRSWLLAPVYTSSLAFFRVLFGLLMLFSLARFWYKGWIYDFYIVPEFYFHFYGFEWVTSPGSPGIYIIFGALIFISLCITTGLFYRLSCFLFFIGFTYVELIDKTHYLNHYYFISLVSFLLIFIPAHRSFSIDKLLFKLPVQTYQPRLFLFVLQLQVAIVYFFGGIAKLKYDWLMEAMPLKIWLHASSGLPLIGPLIEQPWMAYVFSYAGLIFDLTVPFLLWSRKYKWIGYVLVLIFHWFTHALFYIGMFPFFMMFFTLIFLDTSVHHRIISFLSGNRGTIVPGPAFKFPNFLPVFILLFTAEVLLPFRYLLYGGNVLWHEQGYRFSWNIMLMEKNGDVEFTVFDKHSPRQWVVRNKHFLTVQQMRMISTQPDFMLEFAHHMKRVYDEKYRTDTGVRVRAFVALNGRPSRLLIDPQTDLTLYKEGWYGKPYILK